MSSGQDRRLEAFLNGQMDLKERDGFWHHFILNEPYTYLCARHKVTQGQAYLLPLIRLMISIVPSTVVLRWGWQEEAFGWPLFITKVCIMTLEAAHIMAGIVIFVWLLRKDGATFACAFLWPVPSAISGLVRSSNGEFRRLTSIEVLFYSPSPSSLQWWFKGPFEWIFDRRSHLLQVVFSHARKRKPEAEDSSKYGATVIQYVLLPQDIAEILDLWDSTCQSILTLLVGLVLWYDLYLQNGEWFWWYTCLAFYYALGSVDTVFGAAFLACSSVTFSCGSLIIKSLIARDDPELDVGPTDRCYVVGALSTVGLCLSGLLHRYMSFPFGKKLVRSVR